MPIVPVDRDLMKYDHVTICSPVWVFAQAAGQIREADYILVHHQNGVYRNAAEEMDRLLGLRRTGLRSVRCREGRFKTVYEGK